MSFRFGWNRRRLGEHLDQCRGQSFRPRLVGDVRHPYPFYRRVGLARLCPGSLTGHPQRLCGNVDPGRCVVEADIQESGW